MHRSMLSNPLALLALTAVAACGDGTSPSHTAPEITTDVAVSAGEAVSADVALLKGNEGATALAAQVSRATVAGSLGLAAQTAASGCTYSPSTQRYTCASLAEGDFTVTRSFALFDAAGVPQTQYDAATTASIDFEASAAATLTRPSFSATATRDRNVTVSGLVGAETQRTWSGAGTSELQAEFSGDNGSRHYAMTSADTVDNVVWNLPTSYYRYPASGRIIHNITVTQTADAGQTVERTAVRRVVVTFNGARTVFMMVGSLSCTLNLDTRVADCGPI